MRNIRPHAVESLRNDRGIYGIEAHLTRAGQTVPTLCRMTCLLWPLMSDRMTRTVTTFLINAWRMSAGGEGFPRLSIPMGVYNVKSRS